MQKPFVLATLLVIASATLPAASAAKTTNCRIPTPCAVFANSGTGAGIKSSSTTGAAVFGASNAGPGVLGSSSTGPAVDGSSNTGPAVLGKAFNGPGVLGSTASGSFLDPGVRGESGYVSGDDSAGSFGLDGQIGAAPTYGVLAYGGTAGVYGQTLDAGTSSSFGAGVRGDDSEGSSSTDFNIGVNGISAYGTGVLGQANGTPSLGYLGSGLPIGVYAVGNEGQSRAGLGLIAESDSFALDAENTLDGTFVQLASEGNLMHGGNSNSGAGFNLDGSGNLTISGSLYTGNGGPYIRTRGASGAAMTAYAERTTAPEMEDVGEAKLVNGTSFVRIDAALRDDIDNRNAYHVFLTPEGDCNGLFVTQKGPQGFAVHELRGGRSTIAFEYRIVAKPLDENGGRLASFPVLKLPPSLRSVLKATRRHLPLPITPQQHLKERLGARGYAAALAALKSRY